LWDTRENFIWQDKERLKDVQNRLKGDAITLTTAQRAVIESLIPALCERGRWEYRIAAAPPEGDHIHVLLDAKSSIEPGAILMWLKRWVTQELNKRWGKPITAWWSESGSTKPVKDQNYLNNVYHYIRRQRTLPVPTD
jgi:REP element-mobilizing transposase RayT